MSSNESQRRVSPTDMSIIRAPFRLLRRFLRNVRGVAMVEFALVAPPFFLLVLMIIENGLLVFTQAQLDNAARDAARTIMIGTYQTGNQTPSNFKTAVCNGISGMIPSCTSNIQIYADTDGVSPSNLTTAPSGYWNGGSGTFVAGGASQYQIVQVAYRYPYVSRWLALMGGSSALLVSTVVFQNEPFQ
jgi:Flp pilus assembly protein TadG